jgi:TolA-binding protein
MRAALLILLLAATTLGAATPPPSTCRLTGDYERALCAYQKRQFAEAEAAFRAIVEKDEPRPETIRSLYFLSRTLMKTGHFDEASALLIRIYTLDQPFYDGWNCDYLLGECRKAQGKG